MNCDIQVVALVSKERGHTSSLARCVVVSELGQRKQLRPVVLLVVAVSTEILFEDLIDLLSLTIPFRMISLREMKIPWLESQSMTTRMAVNPAEVGRFSMRSIDMESQGCTEMGSGLRSP